jgi:hypothetical protein
MPRNKDAAGINGIENEGRKIRKNAVNAAIWVTATVRAFHFVNGSFLIKNENNNEIATVNEMSSHTKPKAVEVCATSPSSKKND